MVEIPAGCLSSHAIFRDHSTMALSQSMRGESAWPVIRNLYEIIKLSPAQRQKIRLRSEVNAGFQIINTIEVSFRSKTYYQRSFSLYFPHLVIFVDKSHSQPVVFR